MNKTQALKTLLSPDFMIGEVIAVHREIRRYIQQAPAKAFKPYWVPISSTMWKPLAAVDLLAEQLFINAVTYKCGSKNVRIEGEESLNETLNLQQERRTCVLIDMIDGTDLLQRGFSNWCSAIVVFNPQEREIEGAFIAFPLQSMYFATKKEGAFKKPLRSVKEEAPVPLTITVEKSLRDASVCTYAQKSGVLAKLLGELARRNKLTQWLRETAKLESKAKETGRGEVGFRFYNLAGNPMMMRLVDGAVDVVLDINGQAPHDIVPGAFIAVKAGAVLAQSTGKPLTLADLAAGLLRPGNPAARLTYVLGANQRMVQEMTWLLVEEWDRVERRVSDRRGLVRPPQIPTPPPPSPSH